jgi:hypothetical protein
MRRFTKYLALGLAVAVAASCSNEERFTGPTGFPASTSPTAQQVCEVIDFNTFNHGDAIQNLSLFGGELAITVTATRGLNSPTPVNATAYDTERWDGGNPPPNSSHNDTQLAFLCNVANALGASDADCDGIVPVVPASDFNGNGDASNGGTMTFAGLGGPYTYEVPNYWAVDSDDEGQEIFLEVGAGLTEVGRSTGNGNGTVENVETTDHSFTGQFRFTLEGSGGIDNIEVCRTAECDGSIGDFVWNDLNQDGIQDGGEPGLAGWTVNLSDCSGNLLATTTTDANGFYLFSDLDCGCYEVEVVPAAGWTPSPTNQGGDPTLDSNPNPSQTTLTEGAQDDLTIDFGFYMEDGGMEGCTPGYWKQDQHFDSWTLPLDPGALFTDPGFTSPGSRAKVKRGRTVNDVSTQLNALEANQGDLAALTRHAMAALLNAASPDVDYQYNQAEIITWYNEAVAGTRDVETLKDDLDFWNNGSDGCPIN